MSKLPYQLSQEKAIKAFEDDRIEASIYENSNNVMNIEFSYPRSGGNINTLQVGLMDVRAADPIRITYDFDRDGYVVMQSYTKKEDKGDYIDCIDVWEEVGFFQSWALEDKGDRV